MTRVRPGATARRQAIFRPPRVLGASLGAAAAAWCLTLAGFALKAAASGGAEFQTFLGWFAGAVLIVVSGTFVNWAYGIASLAYVVDGETLTIRWGFRRVVIPLDSVLRLVPGRTLDRAHVRGLNWPGCHIGHADLKRIGYTLFYTTHRSQDELIVVHTTQESYALSVLDQATFAEEVQGRTAVAPLASHPQRSAASGIAAIPFWRDGMAISSALLSIGACVLLCGFITYRYPGLPEVIELNFPTMGDVDRVGDKSAVLDIAYAGAGILLLNLAAGLALHVRERAAGLWVLAAGGMLQVILLTAAFTVIQGL